MTPRSLAVVAGVLACSAVPTAPSRDLAALLEAIGAPDLESVLDEFRPCSSFEELLTGAGEPEPGRWLSPEDWAQTRALREQLDEARRAGRREEAIDIAEEMLALAASALGPEHAAARRVRAELEVLESASALAPDALGALDGADANPAQLGYAYLGERSAEAGALALEQTLANAEIRGSETPEVAIGLKRVANSFYEEGAYARAIPVALAALELERRISGDDHLHVASLLNLIGAALRGEGRLEDANQLMLAAYARVRSLVRRADPSAFIILHHLGVLHEELGELRSARFLYALNLSEPGWDVSKDDRATALERLGTISVTLGELDDGEECLQSAHQMRQSLHQGDHPALVRSLSNLALLARARGDYVQAEIGCRAAMDMRRRLWPGDHPSVAQGISILASVLFAKADLEGARREEFRALEMTRRLYGERSAEVASCLQNLAVIHTNLGQYDEGEACAQQAVEVYRASLPRDMLKLAQSLVNRAVALANLRRYDEVRQCNDEAQRILRDMGLERSEFMAVAMELDGALAMLDGDVRSGFARIEAVIETLRSTFGPTHLAISERLVALGELRWLADDPGALEKAEQELSEALSILELRRGTVLGMEHERARFAGRIGHAYAARALARVLLDLGAFDAAVEVAERGRDRALLDLLSRADEDLVEGARRRDPQAARRLEERLRRETAAHAAVLECGRRLDAMRQRTDLGALREQRIRERAQELETATEEQSAAEYAVAEELRASWSARTSASIGEISSALRPGEGLLYWVWGAQSASAFLVPAPGEGEVLAAPLARGMYEVRELARLVEDAERSILAEEAGTSARLVLARRILPAAWWERIRLLDSLVLLPEGPLGRVPFEALPIPWSSETGAEHLLIEEGPDLVYAPSASVLIDLRRRERSSEERAPVALVLGDPRFDVENQDGDPQLALARDAEPIESSWRSAFGGHLRRLAGSGAEARRVSELVREAGGSARVLLREDATLAALEASLAGVTHLHLATHGLVGSAERPYSAALALAPPDELAHEDEGFLTLDRMIRAWRGHLEGCELVVLSACDTQKGAQVGDSQIALPWGFFFAGAPRVVVSLWKVDDAATTLLMARMYESLFGRFDEERTIGARRFEPGTKMSVAQALREAKLWLRGRSAAENRRALADLGYEHLAAESARDGDDAPPGPGGAPARLPRFEPYDFTHPRHWAAFVLTGAPD